MKARFIISFIKRRWTLPVREFLVYETDGKEVECSIESTNDGEDEDFMKLISSILVFWLKLQLPPYNATTHVSTIRGVKAKLLSRRQSL